MGIFGAIGSIFGPVGTAVGSVADYAFNQSEKEDAEDRANQRFDLTRADAQLLNAQNYERQKEFAQMGIRWRADDARAAGFHPTVALGAGGSSYSPSAVVGGSYQEPSSADSGGDDLGRAISAMGQNTKRAEMATKTDVEKRMEDLAVRNAELRNSLLEGQISALWASVLGQPGSPSAPSATGAAVAPVGAIQTKPSQTISTAPGRQHLEAASTPGFQDVRIGGGTALRLPNQSTSEVLENLGPGAGSFVTGLSAAREMWHGPDRGPGYPAPAGMQWVWSPWKQSFSLQPTRAPSPNWTKSLSGGRGSARIN